MEGWDEEMRAVGLATEAPADDATEREVKDVGGGGEGGSDKTEKHAGARLGVVDEPD
jgi:hypothetical protein